jgi:hypothetical protein
MVTDKLSTSEERVENGRGFLSVPTMLFNISTIDIPDLLFNKARTVSPPFSIKASFRILFQSSSVISAAIARF